MISCGRWSLRFYQIVVSFSCAECRVELLGRSGKLDASGQFVVEGLFGDLARNTHPRLDLLGSFDLSGEHACHLVSLLGVAGLVVDEGGQLPGSVVVNARG